MPMDFLHSTKFEIFTIRSGSCYPEPINSIVYLKKVTCQFSGFLIRFLFQPFQGDNLYPFFVDVICCDVDGKIYLVVREFLNLHNFSGSLTWFGSANNLMRQSFPNWYYAYSLKKSDAMVLITLDQIITKGFIYPLSTPNRYHFFPLGNHDHDQ